MKNNFELSEKINEPTSVSDVVDIALQVAKESGASQSEVVASVSQGLSVAGRKGEIETVEHTRDRALAVTVYFGDRIGNATTSDYSVKSIRQTVQSACSIARFTEDDPCHGLADIDLLATKFPDLDLYHPIERSIDEMVEDAKRCEQSALDYDSRIQNSEGSAIDSHEGTEAYGNSNEFLRTS